MSTQPRALALADALLALYSNSLLDERDIRDISAELRRLSALNAQLLEALTAIADDTVRVDGRFAGIAVDRFRVIARAAIKAAEAE